MMKKMLTVFALAVFCLSLVAAGSGSIWTTKNDCGTEQQDVNHFDAGDKVFINGAGFDEETFAWNIVGLPGGASCDPSLVVASQLVSVDETGAFCFEAYTIPTDDCGEYKATVDGKHDNYRTGLPPAQVPEFGTTVGILTALGAVGAFFLVRKK